MLLYLRNESLYRIDTIELIDGCYPRITYDVGTFGSEGVRSPPPAEEYSVSDLNVEPALWGIILILDRVCVDVKRRRFSWATSSVGKILDDEGTEDPLHRTHYADDDRYEYDDNIDELFNLADHLINVSHSRTSNTREGHDEQSSLIRMLYCCILPKVLIYHQDMKKVESAVNKQMSYITKIEQDIERDSQVLDEFYRVLFRQQDERLDQFETIASEKRCTEAFVLALDIDLQKREHQLKGKMDVNQVIVQKIKKDIQDNGETEEKRKQLDEARKLSANIHSILRNVLVASEDNLKSTLKSGGFQSQDNEAVVLDYLTCRQMSQRQKDIATRQMEKKVRAMSILANLERIKDDITKDDGVATARCDASSKCIVRPTDVISDSHVPEYQTLSERVTTIVSNQEHPLGEEFEKFTRHIREYCQQTLKNAELARGSTDTRRKSARKCENGFLVVGNDGTVEEELLTPLEKLCNEVKNHCDQTARLFLEQFNSVHSELLRRKLQLCYEENFYNEVGGDIMKVFEVAYRKCKEKLIHDLNVLKTYPINCLELGMKDEWWLELFEKRRQAHVAHKRSVNKPIRIEVNSCTPSSSERSSVTSISSQSSRGSDKENEKRSSTLRKFLKLVRVKSKDIAASLESDEFTTSRVNTANTGYDDYQSYAANHMSGAIEANDGTLTNNNEKNHISNGKSGISNGTFSTATDDEITTNVSPIKYGDHTSSSSSSAGENDLEEQKFQNELSKFAKYFGPSLDSLTAVFKVSSVFAKLKCLVDSVTKVTESVQKLRSEVLENNDNNYSVAITADDLLPLIVLIMLQMDSEDAANIVVELKMMQDLIPQFLSFGCHNWALVEFELASRVLQSLCTQFDWGTSFTSLSSS